MSQIYCLPAFTDNYFWIIQPSSLTKDAYIIDPGDAEVVIRALNEHQLLLKAVLLTHHHHDHIDGAAELAEHFKIPIYGPKSEKIPIVTHHLFEGNQLALSEHITATIFEIPGHTKDHIAYYFDSDNPKLFSADTIFSAGCGRIFDGDAESLFHSIERLKKLPPNTMIYAAHEYTLNNLRFAEWIEPENINIQNRKKSVEKMRAQQRPSLPTELGEELLFNPFLRTHIQSLQKRVSSLAQVECRNQTEVFRVLRKLKDQFQ